MYRTIDVSIWQELWFEELPPNAKLLFFYLLTNSRQTACGAFQVTQRAICHETNLTATQVRSAMATLTTINKVIWWPDAGWVLLTRFYRHQRANASRTYEVAARKAAAILDETVYQAVATLYPELIDPKRASAYPIDTLSIPYPTRARKTATETATVKQQQEAATEPDAREAPDTPAAPSRSSDPPDALFEALCEETGADEGSASPAFKRKQLGKAKDLLAQGHSAAEVRACVRFLVSQSWRTNTIDLFTVAKEIGGWQFAGSPATAMPARASPGRRGELNTRAVADEIDAVRNGAVAHDDGSIEARLRHTHGRLAEPIRESGGTASGHGDLCRPVG
jgi:hypothetical protein